MLFSIMAEIINPLKKKAAALVAEKPGYRKEARSYLRFWMMEQKQEDLIRWLHDLDYKELRMVISCGVPGDAMRVANDLLADMKKEIEEYLQQRSAQRTSSESVTISVEEEDYAPKTVHTSETRRETGDETVSSPSDS